MTIEGNQTGPGVDVVDKARAYADKLALLSEGSVHPPPATDPNPAAARRRDLGVPAKTGAVAELSRRQHPVAVGPRWPIVVPGRAGSHPFPSWLALQ
ncbi:hypothetical protein [Nocardia niwae]|uniref:Uncharacterized protein n=1 Tax=Nocardia niwae TaxID=626084 RepID=A0ABV2X3H0_9NOCA